MTIFDIILNGKPYGAFGITGDGVLTASLSLVRRGKGKAGKGKPDMQGDEIQIEVGGLQSRASGKKETLHWRGCDLGVGDEIIIRVRNARKCSPPDTVTSNDPSKEIKQKREYLKVLKRQLGEK